MPAALTQAQREEVKRLAWFIKGHTQDRVNSWNPSFQGKRREATEVMAIIPYKDEYSEEFRIGSTLVE